MAVDVPSSVHVQAKKQRAENILFLFLIFLFIIIITILFVNVFLIILFCLLSFLELINMKVYMNKNLHLLNSSSNKQDKLCTYTEIRYTDMSHADYRA